MWIYIVCVTFIPLMSCFLSLDLGISKNLAGDNYIFVGDNLSLTCSPSPDQLENYGLNNVSFSFFKPLQPGSQPKCLPISLVHINEDHQSAKLVVPNVTLDAAGQYTCHIGRQHCHEVQNMQDLENVGVAEVRVEYRPYNVSRFGCVFYNWNDSVNCTWQHPVDYNDLSNISINVVYTVSSRHPLAAFRCPHITHHACTFMNNEAFFLENYVIEVNITNTVKNITASKVFQVNAYKSVKPAPVINLSAQPMTGCIILSWGHSRNYQKVYRIRHHSVGDNNIEVVNDNISHTHFTQCGYQSYTHHNFSVDCYPAGIYSGYWSDPVYIDAWTPMTAPNAGPTTVNGSYTSTKCVNGYRNVTLMWQEVEESERNGIIDSYVIQHGEKHLKSVKSDVHLTVVELPCGSTSELAIFSHNKGGYSLKPSIMVISPDIFTVPKSLRESFVVEISGSSNSEHTESLRAVWNMTEHTKQLNYTIFWCLGLPGDTCEGPINWSEVPGSTMHYDFPKLDEEAQKYMFGISVNDVQTARASNIFWTGCLFRHQSSLSRVKLETMYVESGAEYVRVAWNPVQCSYQNPVKVSAYLVKWCEEHHCNDTDKVFNATVRASESSYMVTPLKAEVNYKLTVQPVVDGHPGEEFLPWKVASPLAAAGQSFMWLWALAIVPVALALIYGLMKCVSQRKQIKTMTENPLLVLPPVDHHRDSPCVSHSASEESLRPGPSGAATVHYRPHNETASIISNEGISDEATSANSSENGYAADPYDNSRTRLIKPTRQKEAQRQALPQAADCVDFNSSYVHAGLASALASSSQESDHTDAGETVLTGEISSEDGQALASVTTGTESVDTYVQCTLELGAQRDQKDIREQDCPRTQIHRHINTHADHIVLHVQQSKDAPSLIPAEDYSNMTVYDSIHDIQNPGDTVTNVEPTAPSVIGAQSPGIDLGNSDSEIVAPRNSGNGRVALGNCDSQRVNLGNSGSTGNLSSLTNSDISFEIQGESSSEQSGSHSRARCGDGYIPHQEVEDSTKHPSC